MFSAFPDFLAKVYRAAVNLQSLWQQGEDVYVSLPNRLRHKERVPPQDLTTVPPLEGGLVPFGSSLESSDSGLEEELTRAESSSEKYRDAVVHLLEALEILSPGSDKLNNNNVARKLEAVVDKLKLEGGQRSVLLRRLEVLKNKTRNFLNNSAKKKQESIRRMTEVEMKRNRYDYAPSTEVTLVLFSGLLLSVNELMLEDKDMRTGKLLLKDDCRENSLCDFDTSETHHNPNSLIANDDKFRSEAPNSVTTPIDIDDKFRSETQMSVKNRRISDSSAESCKCCACDLPEPSKSWYDYTRLLSWWSSQVNSNDDSKLFCDNCSCEHKGHQSSHDKRDDDEERESIHHQIDSKENEDENLHCTQSLFSSSLFSRNGFSWYEIYRFLTFRPTNEFLNSSNNNGSSSSRESNSLVPNVQWYRKLWGYIF